MGQGLQGRTAVVTGATRGIGRAIAQRFAQAGLRVLVVGRTLADAEHVAAEIGGGASGCAADVADQGSTQRMAALAVERYGGIDVLCANAGIFPRARIDEMRVEEFDTMLAVNLRSTFLCTQACLPAMKQAQRGRIVIIGSVTGTLGGYPGYAHYGASKAGQLGFMRSAAIELAPWQITVNAVLPGNITTDEQPAAKHAYQDKKRVMSPLRRLARPEEVAAAALFFCTDDAGGITGQSLVVDAGQTLPESPSAVDEAMAAAGKE
jgi:3-oxoacyl-[acyl-carrier protein] reductase